MPLITVYCGIKKSLKYTGNLQQYQEQCWWRRGIGNSLAALRLWAHWCCSHQATEQHWRERLRWHHSLLLPQTQHCKGRGSHLDWEPTALREDHYYKYYASNTSVKSSECEMNLQRANWIRCWKYSANSCSFWNFFSVTTLLHSQIFNKNMNIISICT